MWKCGTPCRSLHVKAKSLCWRAAPLDCLSAAIMLKGGPPGAFSRQRPVARASAGALDCPGPPPGFGSHVSLTGASLRSIASTAVVKRLPAEPLNAHGARTSGPSREAALLLEAQRSSLPASP
ncbi:hypothetical protein AAFF_G00292040 [Aldrovandia affinis]|uniref:Uncharacterized protein n=1 Tax=Aldrovandia affinis TaxID=143900 RepID=A0AAD7SQU4_9TELE|nr:hypothetical protein AAFF_G00292040 [Aldrovandia affinis]